MSYHNKIMNLATNADEPRARTLNYKIGHKDARYAAAVIVSDAEALIAEMLEALKALVNLKITQSHLALHPSKRFCNECGRNSETEVHFDGCPVLIAEQAIAKAEPS